MPVTHAFRRRVEREPEGSLPVGTGEQWDRFVERVAEADVDVPVQAAGVGGVGKVMDREHEMVRQIAFARAVGAVHTADVPDDVVAERLPSSSLNPPLRWKQ